MKHLLTLTALLISSLAMGQFPKLPYNPDDNADGLIGVADLQTLLANYGQEFSSAVVSEDGESAIVYMGGMEYPQCKYSCDHLPGMWHLPEVEDLVPVWTEATSQPYTWLRPSEYVSNSMGDGNAFQKLYRYASATKSNISTGYSTSRHCYCAAKQLPRVEYSYCAGGNPSEAAFNQCISDKFADGWYPLDGFPNHHDYQGYGSAGAQSNGDYRVNTVPKTHASFWRWAE